MYHDNEEQVPVKAGIRRNRGSSGRRWGSTLGWGSHSRRALWRGRERWKKEGPPAGRKKELWVVEGAPGLCWWQENPCSYRRSDREPGPSGDLQHKQESQLQLSVDMDLCFNIWYWMFRMNSLGSIPSYCLNRSTSFTFIVAPLNPERSRYGKQMMNKWTNASWKSLWCHTDLTIELVCY